MIRGLKGQEAVNDFLRRLAERLQVLYDARPKDVLVQRAAVFAQAKREVAAICESMGVMDQLCLPEAELNNAIVLSRLTYGSPAPFEKFYAASGQDWRRFFHILRSRYEEKPWYPP